MKLKRIILLFSLALFLFFVGCAKADEKSYVAYHYDTIDDGLPLGGDFSQQYIHEGKTAQYDKYSDATMPRTYEIQVLQQKIVGEYQYSRVLFDGEGIVHFYDKFELYSDKSLRRLELESVLEEHASYSSTQLYETAKSVIQEISGVNVEEYRFGEHSTNAHETEKGKMIPAKYTYSFRKYIDEMETTDYVIVSLNTDGSLRSYSAGPAFGKLTEDTDCHFDLNMVKDAIQERVSLIYEDAYSTYDKVVLYTPIDYGAIKMRLSEEGEPYLIVYVGLYAVEDDIAVKETMSAVVIFKSSPSDQYLK